jgi:hypothetical protein
MLNQNKIQSEVNIKVNNSQFELTKKSKYTPNDMNLLCPSIFCKIRRQNNPTVPKIYQNFHSLHACCKWTITHLKENYSQTVKVNFLETQEKTSNLYHTFKYSCLGGLLIQYSAVYCFVTSHSSIRHNSKSSADQALKMKYTSIVSFQEGEYHSSHILAKTDATIYHIYLNTM